MPDLLCRGGFLLSSQKSFGRYAILTVYNTESALDANGSPLFVQNDKTGKSFPSTLPDGTTGFRIKFKVDKVAAVTSATPNPISISIYNLGPNSRALVSKTNNLLVLEAGYAGNTQQIFKGNIMWGRTHKEGPDYITNIQAADGLFAFQNSRVDMSFNAGISTNNVINSLVGVLKNSGVGPGQVIGVPSGGYNLGVVFSGRTVEELKRVCDKNNLQFSIQDGNVLILPYGADKGTPAMVFSPNTGLIGIPEIRTTGAGGGSLISFKSLMTPSLGIHQQVVLQSKFINGIYTTARVTHDGDTFEGPFFTEVECA